MAAPEPFSWTPIIVPLASAGASFFGAWLAAHLALHRFYRERLWDRKAAAYTAIFESLHKIERWYEKHFEAAIVGETLPEERVSHLRAEANTAEDDLESRLASETWLIPELSRQRLEQMITDLKNSKYREREWQGFLNDGIGIVHKATTALREQVQKDLLVNVHWYQRL